MRRSAESQIVVIFLSCWLVIVRELSSGMDKAKSMSAGSAGGWNTDDKAFGADGYDFAGCGDAYRVQIPVPGLV
jgi:hypothetical protein